jgi:3-oxoacyl-[acyl-carrier-protein] synthase II
VSRRRVVVTGLGLISPVGNNVADGWANLVAGKSGIANVTKFDASNFSTRFAGEVKGFNIEDYIPAKEARHMDTFIHYGVAAGIQAMQDSGLEVTDENSERIGVVVGSGIGGLPMIEVTQTELLNRGPRRISPFFVPASIINMISGHLSIRFGLKGPNLSMVTACTTGLHCIGEASRLIEYGDADVMIAGGAEATVSPLGIGGFAAARALSQRNDDPATASRPWDTDRDGFVLGEGAGGQESVFTVLAIHNQVSPPTINIFNQDPKCDLDYCANTAREMKIDVAVKNSFGFGGTNGSLVFKRH